MSNAEAKTIQAKITAQLGSKMAKGCWFPIAEMDTECHSAHRIIRTAAGFEVTAFVDDYRGRYTVHYAKTARKLAAMIADNG